MALPPSVKHWSLTKLQEKLIRVGAKVGTHSRYVIFQVAEVAVPKRLFWRILERIRRLGLPETVPRQLPRRTKQPGDTETTGSVCADWP